MSDVRIADLKARLSEHLRSVRNGGTVAWPSRTVAAAGDPRRGARRSGPRLRVRRSRHL